MTKKEGNNNDCKNNCTECSCSADSSPTPFQSGFSPHNIQSYYQPKILHKEEQYFYYDKVINASIVFHPRENNAPLFAAFLYEFGVIIHFKEAPGGFQPTMMHPMERLDEEGKEYCSSMLPEKSELKEDIACPPHVQMLMAALYEIESVMNDTPAAETLTAQGITLQ